MPFQNLRNRILAFSAHVGHVNQQSPEAVARRRNWLSETGDVTEDGRALIAALDDQQETRSVFRGIF